MKRILVAALLCLLLAPASANAWWIGGSGQTVYVHAEPGEVNTFTIDMNQVPAATDATATFSGTFCSLGCPERQLSASVDAGDEDDSITICCPGRDDDGGRSQITPGPGRDTVVITGSSAMVVWARDGEEVDTITCPQDDDGIVVIADDVDITHHCSVVERRNPRPPITATVTTTADEHDDVCDASCSFRDAVFEVSANGSGTVILPPGTFELDDWYRFINRGMTIRGAGANATVIRDGLWAHNGGRPGDVAPGAITITDLTLQSEAPAVTGLVADGDLTLERVRLLGAGTRTGISSSSDLVVRDSLISGFGTGIDSRCSDCLTVENSTITYDGPTDPYGSALIATSSRAQLMHVTLTTPGTAISGPAELRGSIVVGDCSPSTYRPDLVTSSRGGNVVTQATCAADSVGDPQLGPLTDNGGPTETRAPAFTSPARDHATCALATDQRGAPRPAGAGCDSGAVELAVPAADSPPPALKVPDRVKPSVRSIKPSLRRGTYARLRGLAVRFSVSEPARVKVALRHSKSGGVLRSTSASVGAGAQKLVVGSKLLRKSLKKRGYVVTITATDAAGNRSATYSFTLRLR